MARSFGDRAAESVGVFAVPELTNVRVGPRDAFLIVATDGVWEFMSSQEAVDIVVERGEGDPARACKALVDEARRCVFDHCLSPPLAVCMTMCLRACLSGAVDGRRRRT